MSDIERSIDGIAKTIAGVLANQKYAIDYYQREYKWESKQIAELVADLTAKFLELFQSDHARKDVATYPGYFLGSIIISQLPIPTGATCDALAGASANANGSGLAPIRV